MEIRSRIYVVLLVFLFIYILFVLFNEINKHSKKQSVCPLIMARSFTVTLPSNVTSFSNNTMADFTTILPKVLALDGEWEVALSEISYTKSWFNVPQNQEIFLYTRKGIVGETRANLTRGCYENIEVLVQMINTVISNIEDVHEPFFKEMPRLTLIAHTKRLTMIAGEDLNGNRVYAKLGPDMEKLLGFQGPETNYFYNTRFNTNNNVSIQLYGDREEFNKSFIEAARPYDINAGVHSLFVYTDLVDPTFVGDTYAQLLRTVKIPKVDFGEQCVVTYENPNFVPVVANEISTIKINIKDDAGDDITFQFGRVIVTLQFRQWKNSM